MLLELINKTGDIKKRPQQKYQELAGEIRHFLIESISKTGGHLASNLGAVELTMALHLALDLPKDKIIWDSQSRSEKALQCLLPRRDISCFKTQYGDNCTYSSGLAS